MIEISVEDIEKAMEKLDAFGNKLRPIIAPFLNDKLSQKQRIEICHVGKFVVLLGNDSKIIEHDNSPDFIIQFEKDRIGVEHQRILRLDKVVSHKSTEKLFEDAALLFKSEHPGINILVNCWLTEETFSFTKQESNTLKKQISDYIFAIVNKSEDFQKPWFIDEILFMEHTDVEFVYNPGGFMVKRLESDSLNEAIQKKEKLIENYKAKSKLEKQWLLLVIGATSPDSYKVNVNEIAIEKSSKFERIYLMEDFDARLWRLL